ncbi:Cleavage and polyadenylation specificity factor subunit 4 [Binucleata daphniae]
MKDIRFNFEDYIENVLGLKEQDDVYCSAYQTYQCYDKNCQKMHIRLDKAVVCKHWLRGLCKKTRNCEFLHEYDLKRMPECWFFSKYGECSNNECYFLHIDPNSKCRECLWYKRGFCKNGAMCRNKHIKMKLCKDYFYGFCLQGENCGLGHAKFEVIDSVEQRIEKRKNVIGKKSNIIENVNSE